MNINDLWEQLRQALGHDELPSDEGLIKDVREWIRLARVPAPQDVPADAPPESLRSGN